jgi:hypothetical protein
MKEEIMQELRKITGKDNIALTESGNSAIEAAMLITKNLKKTKILIPDQGGWFSYRKIPIRLNIEYEEIVTDKSVIIPEELKKHKDCAFIFTTFGGYFAEQPLKKIYSICKKNNILLIEDATGSTGWRKSKADIIICSFSKWKPLNLGYGGLIAANNPEFLGLIDDFLEKKRFEKEDLDKELMKKIKALPKRYKFFFNLQKKVKKELRDFTIIHRREKGLNVVVSYENDEEREKLINYCRKNNYEFVNCPNYIKVNEQAISIELKRLEE